MFDRTARQSLAKGRSADFASRFQWTEQEESIAEVNPRAWMDAARKDAIIEVAMIHGRLQSTRKKHCCTSLCNEDKATRSSCKALALFAADDWIAGR
jgi:hypothetical protein